MNRIILFLSFSVTVWSNPLHNPFQHVAPLAYPFAADHSDINYGLNYAPQQQQYSSYIPTYTNEYIQDFSDFGILPPGYSALPESQPTLNILAELPYSISNQFAVVPLYIVSKNTMNVLSHEHITSVSPNQPTMTGKSKEKNSVECTPAVRIVLEKPIIVGSLKSNIMFPTEVQILHDGKKIPIKIGAVIAPVLPQTYVSQQTPIAVKVVYAVPTKPIKITITFEQDGENKPAQTGSRPTEQKPVDDGFGALGTSDYVNNENAVFKPEQEAVVVESEPNSAPENITVIDFPQEEAVPHIDIVDEEDDELVNRNPPLDLAPAGIVQSTQPGQHTQLFHNDKESPYLDTIREESKRKRI